MKRGKDLVSSVTTKCAVSLRRLTREELEMSLSWKEMVTVDTESPVTPVKDGSHVSTPSASPQNAEKVQQCQEMVTVDTESCVTPVKDGSHLSTPSASPQNAEKAQQCQEMETVDTESSVTPVKNGSHVSTPSATPQDAEKAQQCQEMVTVDTESPVTPVKDGSHMSSPSASPQNAEKAQQCQEMETVDIESSVTPVKNGSHVSTPSASPQNAEKAQQCQEMVTVDTESSVTPVKNGSHVSTPSASPQNAEKVQQCQEMVTVDTESSVTPVKDGSHMSTPSASPQNAEKAQQCQLWKDLVSSVTTKCAVSLRRLTREELEMSLSWKEMITVDTESPVTPDKDLAPVGEKTVGTMGARRSMARICSENGAHGFVLDELVWAKGKDLSWWPALVVQWTDGSDPAHMRRVERFGDDTFSEIHTDGLLPFSDFAKCFCFVSYAGLPKYQTAIYQALELAGERCKKSFSSASGSKEEGMRSMLAWAFGGFQPTGPVGFIPTPDDEETAEVDSESDFDSDSSECGYEPPSKRRKQPTQRTIATQPQNREVDFDSDSSECDYEPPSKRRKQPTQRTIAPQPQNRGHILAELAERSIESFCISCGSYEPEVEHPLFEGGLCARCKRNFTETLYTYDEDGSQSYCTVCCWGHEVVLCGNASCTRCFCKDCLEFLVGEGTFERMKEVDPWSCYMCEPVEESGALRLRTDWSTRVQHFFANSCGLHFDPHRVYPAIPAQQRRPIRVLSLFDGIATGYLVLKELGFQIELYVAAEICRESVAVGAIQHERQIKHIRDVRSITRKHLAEWGQFDLLIGGSPCNDLCTVNPHRKGLFEGTGRLFFEYYRMLTMLMPREDDDRPFFFLFENVVRMSNNDKNDICRFLECNPVMLDAASVSPAHRARYFWGNLPGMNRRLVPTHNDRVNLQDCLEHGRTAKCTKLKTITTRFPIKGKSAGMSPVIMDGENDDLWSTELERVFGFPKHYTDVANMNRAKRQELLGKSWSVPVIRHLLSPLKDYFLCN